MRHRIMDILLVSSPYDSFLLEEAGEISERLLGEFRNLDLHYGPGLTSVSSGREALELLRDQQRFNLVVATLNFGDMNAAELAREVRGRGFDVPVVALAFDTLELKDFLARYDTGAVDKVFLWQGDARILLAIVKYVEDKRNVAHDVAIAGVQVILLIEDNVRYYSSFLPALYTELLRQSQRLVLEGMNLSHAITRMRARPKILLCGTFEEAWDAFVKYGDDVLGVISDVEFPWAGERSAGAGFALAQKVRESYSDVPIILQSSRPENEARAREVGADFLLKGSPTLLHDLQRVISEYFGFGDFVFRTPDGTEVGRASDLKSLEDLLRTAPSESIQYHAERNHFSKWLKARTEFALAHDLRPRKVSDFPTPEGLRQILIDSIAAYRERQERIFVADFDRATFDLGHDFYRMGGGSLGGKARGLAFARRLLADARLSKNFPQIDVVVPACAVVGTDVFDRFLDEQDLRDFAIHCDDDDELAARFDAASLPVSATADLRAYLDRVRTPLAVRSSSLLEDSQHQPFSGVYATHMLNNDHPFLEVRLDQLVRAIKRVYASTFSSHAKAYIRATPYRLEEEKMAVILQRVVGDTYNDRFYPHFSGVARSYNFYPHPPLRSEDGVAAVALGLGRTVADGGNCLRFCPRHPKHALSFATAVDALKYSQRQFWALSLSADGDSQAATTDALFGVDVAETDGTLGAVGSTYSPENDAVYEGLSRPGIRFVSFAPVLKHGLFPLAAILERLLAIGSWGVGAPVEIEFAVRLAARGGRSEFAFLQMRPLALASEREALEIGAIDPSRTLCRSSSVLGHGRLDTIRDLVVVDAERFERSRSAEVARCISQINARLVDEKTPYALIGVGRWGSRDPWLGIPVAWDQISGARVIVEAGFHDVKVTPSQGSHFFQNLTSFNVGYFTVNPDAGEGYVDWMWLANHQASNEAGVVRHLRLDSPIVVLMDGRQNRGVILKPQA